MEDKLLYSEVHEHEEAVEKLFQTTEKDIQDDKIELSDL